MNEAELDGLKRILPRPSNGLYPTAQCISALFRHFRECKSNAEAMMHSDRMEVITGLGDRRLRQLAEEKYFPPPVKAHYQTLETLVGVIRFYRTTSSSETLLKKRLAKMDQEMRDRQIDIDEKEKLLKPIKFFADKIFQLGAEINTTLDFQLNDRLPALNAGLPALEQRKKTRIVYLDILKRFQDFAKQWT